MKIVSSTIFFNSVFSSAVFRKKSTICTWDSVCLSFKSHFLLVYISSSFFSTSLCFIFSILSFLSLPIYSTVSCLFFDDSHVTFLSTQSLLLLLQIHFLNLLSYLIISSSSSHTSSLSSHFRVMTFPLILLISWLWGVISCVGWHHAPGMCFSSVLCLYSFPFRSQYLP